MKNINRFHIARILGTILLLAVANIGFGQTPEQTDVRELPPNQTVEREMAGKATHRYKFDVQKDEFFQVCVEQKSLDITLKFTEATSGKVLATMDSPNGKEGFETLSFVAAQAGSFVLEVAALDARAEKGNYILVRTVSREATAADRRRVEVERLFVEAIGARDAKQTEVALDKLKESLKGWQELDDKYLTDLTEKQIKAIELKPITDALVGEFTLPQHLVTEGQKLMREGTTESFLKAQPKLNEAVELSRKFYKKLDEENLTNILPEATKADWKLLIKLNEVSGLSALGSLNDFLRNWEEAISYNKLAVKVTEEIRQNPEIRKSQYYSTIANLKTQEAGILDNIGSTLGSYLNKPQEGITYANQALTLWREVQLEDKKFSEFARYQESLTLFQLGQKYRSLSDRQKALEYFKESLKIVRDVPNQRNQEAAVLTEISNVYDSELNYAESLEYQKNALKIYEEIDDKPNQANILQLIGLSYFNLNNEAKAREYFNQVLAILLADSYLEYFEKQKIVIPFPQDFKTEDFNLLPFQKDLNEWNRNISVGNIYGFLGKKDKQLQFLEKSLISARSVKHPQMIELSLSLIGFYYGDKKDWQKALNYYEQALETSRSLPKDNSAQELSNIAYIYFEMKNWQNSLQNANEALRIYQSLGADKDKLFTGYGTVLNTAARTYWELGNRRLALFYGKQAVNAIQRERQQLQSLDKESQRGYLKKNEKPYRRLADWLIAEGRIAEAEEVLDMLKEEEYFSYLRRDDKAAADLKSRIALSPDEKKAFDDYEKFAGDITRAAEEYEALKKKIPFGGTAESLLPDERKRYAELELQYNAAVTVFNKFLDDLKVKFGKENAAVAKVESDTIGLLKKLNQPRTVIISTIVGEDRLNLIVTTSDVQKAHTVEIKAADLNKLVADFRETVKNPNLDPRPLGKRLYDKLFPAALQKDLENIKADTIVWSLDGTLRYVPMSTLWDGEKYLVERYNQAVITLASRDKLESNPNANRQNWVAFGVGVSKSFENFNPLPAVPKELCSVVKDAKQKEFCASLGETGVFGGVMLRDEEFTYDIFKQNLGKTPIVHIASHFALNPGEYDQSYLLLGGGANRRFSLVDVRNTRLDGIELLTLSACNTAMTSGNASNGLEVEGFGALAQNQGVKSVLATLWAVADDSTGKLMTDFYKIMETDPQVGKAEAMRQAQINLIKGANDSKQFAETRRSEIVRIGAGATSQPKFVKDPNAPFAHPYFWSPFVLIGNWK